VEACLFCDHCEPGHGSSCEYVCGSCVQLLLNADLEDLKRAHTKAIDKGYQNKAKAIEFFIEKENPNGQRKPKIRKHERHPNRARIVRPVRNKKKPLRRTTVEAPASLL
jgi:hypothetical protein